MVTGREHGLPFAKGLQLMLGGWKLRPLNGSASADCGAWNGATKWSRPTGEGEQNSLVSFVDSPLTRGP